MNPAALIPRPFPRVQLPVLMAALFAISPALAAPVAPADQEAVAILKATQAKLASSPTLSVVARHEGSAEISGSTNDSSPLLLTVQRPNLFHAHQGKGQSERVMGYDGKVLRVLFPGTLLHTEAPLPSRDMTGFADAVDAKFGFRPPLAELLAVDLVAEMARGGATIRHAGIQRVGWTPCHHIVVTQPGQTTELWLGKKDALPRRYKITLTDLPGKPSKQTTFKKWKIGVPSDPALFAPPAPEGSHLVPFQKSR